MSSPGPRPEHSKLPSFINTCSGNPLLNCRLKWRVGCSRSYLPIKALAEIFAVDVNGNGRSDGYGPTLAARLCPRQSYFTRRACGCLRQGVFFPKCFIPCGVVLLRRGCIESYGALGDYVGRACASVEGVPRWWRLLSKESN